MLLPLDKRAVLLTIGPLIINTMSLTISKITGVPPLLGLGSIKIKVVVTSKEITLPVNVIVDPSGQVGTTTDIIVVLITGLLPVITVNVRGIYNEEIHKEIYF